MLYFVMTIQSFWLRCYVMWLYEKSLKSLKVIKVVKYRHIKSSSPYHSAACHMDILSSTVQYATNTVAAFQHHGQQHSTATINVSLTLILQVQTRDGD